MSKSFLWSAIERFSTQIIQFIIGIILARLLGPSDYGIIGIIIVINSFLQIFIDSGFTKALIQKQDRTINDFNSVFVFNIGIGLVSYLLLFIASPFIEKFYNIIHLALYIKIVGLSLIINTFYAVLQIDFTIKLDFKSIAKVNLISSLISGIIAVIMAYMGCGIWALIVQFVLKSLLTLIIFLFIKEHKLKFSYTHSSIVELYKFGSNILYGSLLNNIVNNFSTIFIGKIYNVQSVGYYTRGTQFTDVAYNTFNSILDSVLLPIFSKISGDIKSIKIEFIKIYRYSMLLLLPIFILLALLAEPIIKILLTDKWLMAVPIMQFFAIARFITILSGINVNIIYALGKSNLVLKQQVFKIIVRVVLLLIAIPFGIYYVALAELVSTIIHYFINTYYPGKILKFSGIRQIMSCAKIILCSLSFVIVYSFSKILFTSDYIIILSTSIVGLLFYILLLKALKVDEVNIDLQKILKL
ncbi:lipopolysaccharide biosynthesis protein [Empedobacter stercoris]|uniref:lipopolysaccharide biosynthesis protein n=1 Tax=Empedobacter stercoris TaxID=1628248 RepID=UPI0016627BF1|nr:lipopolysaccharide biosynthesis protein [Empedobacter stercoris]MCA4808829.1 lipopolysaccharide biosynthesis protein [Empedobacter stercoris]QNT15355.1 lipopolysaccharide biosynthesis protein [Empedobacter stercoris]